MFFRLILITTAVVLASFTNSFSALLVDAEVAGFTNPTGFKADTGLFSDAHYVMSSREIDFTVMVKNKGAINLSGLSVRFSFFEESSDGKFDQPVFSISRNVDILSNDSALVTLNHRELNNWNFIQSYYYMPLFNPKYIIPPMFRTMSRNVTPRYKVVVNVPIDQDVTNDSTEKIFRFFFSDSKILLSVENSHILLDQRSSKDKIAGKLNSDSLCSALLRIGINSYGSTTSYDLFDRKCWEPRSVDYTGYNYMLWADGDDKPPTKNDISDLKLYLSSYKQDINGSDVKNLAICSQEMVRELSKDNENRDTVFLNQSLGLELAPPGNPMGADSLTYSNTAIGKSILKNQSLTISPTAYAGDVNPICGLVRKSNISGSGYSQTALSYVQHPASTTDSAMGIKHSNIYNSTLYMAVDWRNLSDNALLMNAIIDFFQENRGLFGWMSVEINPKKIQKYPGDTLNYNIIAKWDSPPYVPIVSVIIYDSLTNKRVGTTTNSLGAGFYNVTVPANAAPGLYNINFNYIYQTLLRYSNITCQVEVLSDSAYVSGDFSACMNDTVTYKASGPDRTYTWTTDDKGQIIGSSTDSIVRVKWNDAGYQKLTLSQVITPTKISKDYIFDITVLPAPPQPVVYRRADTLFSSAGTGNQWYIDGKRIYGATSYYYIARTNGDYSVEAMGANGCKSLMSQSLPVITDVIDANSAADLYPNPAGDKINLDNKYLGAGYKIYSIVGLLMQESKLVDNSLDITGLNTGAYYININSDILRFIKK